MTDGKVLITGTGRAGTTLLVAILTDLELDTGYRPGVQANMSSGGLEHNIERPGTPRIVKSPGLSTRLARLLDEGTVAVDHVIVPIRDLDVAAASRVRVAGYGRHLGVRGGFTGTRRASRQGDVLARMLYELVHTIAEYDLPHTLLAFPRFARDPEYTYRKLGFLAPHLGLDEWKAAIEGRARPEQINEAPLARSERLRAAALTPVSALRRAFGTRH